MRICSRFGLLMVIASSLFMGCSGLDEENNNIVIGTGMALKGEFVPQSEINTIFNLTNQLRTGSEANYVDQSGKTVNVTGLKALVLDESLSKAARERAKEVAVSFSHTRPNGQTCWTLYTEQGAAGACGENIAAGSSTGTATFKQWKEDGKPYSGQGHRRNMLSISATRIGIAGFRVTDYGLVDVSKYPDHWGNVGSYYWVMVLGR